MAGPCEHTNEFSVLRTSVEFLDYFTYYKSFIYKSTSMASAWYKHFGEP